MKNSLKWLDFILLLIGVTGIVLYILFSAGVIWNNFSNPLANSLFAVLNILFTFYISYKITSFAFYRQNIYHQKKLAKTAIRHIRRYVSHLRKLKETIDIKKRRIQNDMFNDLLDDIKGNIHMIEEGVSDSQYDFQEIVDSEIKEELELKNEIKEELVEKLHEQKKLQEKRSNLNEKEINKLEGKILELDANINKKLKSLPFGNSITIPDLEEGSLTLNAEETEKILANINGEGLLSGTSIEDLGGNFQDIRKKVDKEKNDKNK